MIGRRRHGDAKAGGDRSSPEQSTTSADPRLRRARASRGSTTSSSLRDDPSGRRRTGCSPAAPNWRMAVAYPASVLTSGPGNTSCRTTLHPRSRAAATSGAPTARPPSSPRYRRPCARSSRSGSPAGRRGPGPRASTRPRAAAAQMAPCWWKSPRSGCCSHPTAGGASASERELRQSIPRGSGGVADRHVDTQAYRHRLAHLAADRIRPVARHRRLRRFFSRLLAAPSRAPPPTAGTGCGW